MWKMYCCFLSYMSSVSVFVSSAWDRRTGAQVAIKKLHRPFQSKLFAKRAYRELRLLKHMRHENVRFFRFVRRGSFFATVVDFLAGSSQVIGLLDVFTAEISLDRFRDLWVPAFPHTRLALGGVYHSSFSPPSAVTWWCLLWAPTSVS